MNRQCRIRERFIKQLKVNEILKKIKHFPIAGRWEWYYHSFGYAQLRRFPFRDAPVSQCILTPWFLSSA